MTVLREGDLEFDFDDNCWEVRKYDKEGYYYRTQMANKLEPTKAVDFLCLRDAPSLLIMEVKDFSRGVPDNEKFKALPETVAIKVRDTVAGIIGGSHNAGDLCEKEFFKKAYRKLNRAPCVIFFFEDLSTPARRPPQRTMNKKDVLRKKLKKHLKWLTRDVAVLGSSDYGEILNDLTVQRVQNPTQHN